LEPRRLDQRAPTVRQSRANAKSSSEPKTAAGKARAAQNAFRHGLNVPVLSDPLLAPEIEAMARRISGRYPSRSQIESDGVQYMSKGHNWKLIP
jgi:hypothetical protein